jgi:rod shape-determining protein MreC
MEYSPPPLFRQGPSALFRLIVFVALAVALLITDAHYKTLGALRQVVGTVIYPLQRTALTPREISLAVYAFFRNGQDLRDANRMLSARNLQLAMRAQQEAQLEAENRHLRGLLKLAERSTIGAVPAEIQYDTRDPFTQKVIIDHGMSAGIRAGSPVINEEGLVGQITRVYAMQSELTLLTDKDQAVPVQDVRSGVRSIIYGTPRGDTLDLRFVPVGADVQAGDTLVTSGLDGVYPPGLPVARVLRVDRQGETAFARVICVPVSPVRGARQLLVLQYSEPMPLRPDVAEPASDAKARKGQGARAHSGDASEPAPAGRGASAASAARPAVAARPAATRPASVARSASAASAARSPHRGHAQ